MPDIAHELSVAIRHRGKDATGDDVAFDLGEPQFDWLSQEEYVGVKCNGTLGSWARNASTRAVLYVERLSAIT